MTWPGLAVVSSKFGVWAFRSCACHWLSWRTCLVTVFSPSMWLPGWRSPDRVFGAHESAAACGHAATISFCPAACSWVMLYCSCCFHHSCPRSLPNSWCMRKLRHTFTSMVLSKRFCFSFSAMAQKSNPKALAGTDDRGGFGVFRTTAIGILRFCRLARGNIGPPLVLPQQPEGSHKRTGYERHVPDNDQSKELDPWLLVISFRNLAVRVIIVLPWHFALLLTNWGPF